MHESSFSKFYIRWHLPEKDNIHAIISILMNYKNKTTVNIFTGHNKVVAKVMFLQASVILSTGGVCFSACWDTTPLWEQTPPPRADTPTEQKPPWEQTPPPTSRRHPWPGAHTPRGAHTPPEQTPPQADTPPGSRPPPPPSEAGSGILSMSGRYASYWNAFLFKFAEMSHELIAEIYQQKTFQILTAFHLRKTRHRVH